MHTAEIPHNPPREVMAEIVAYHFPDYPVMVDVARCESGLRQYVGDEPITSHTSDYGLFQVNQIWLSTADRMNINVKTLSGNIVMARYILMTQGLDAWKASSHCWNT